MYASASLDVEHSRELVPRAILRTCKPEVWVECTERTGKQDNDERGNTIQSENNRAQGFEDVRGSVCACKANPTYGQTTLDLWMYVLLFS